LELNTTGATINIQTEPGINVGRVQYLRIAAGTGYTSTNRALQ